MKGLIFKITLLFIIVFILFGCSLDGKKYMSGRDTLKSFGNGRFQILENPDKTKVLVDVEKIINIEENISNYTNNNNKIYIKGTKGYTVLNYKTGELKQSSKINDFLLKDQKVLKRIN